MTEPILPISPPRAWAEIHLDALRKNLSVAREASGSEIMAVVKAGAYGHGLEEIARTFARENITFLGVANVGEARRIRNAGVETPIYLLGTAWAGEREEVVALGLTPFLSTEEDARHYHLLAGRANTRLRVHIGVDTGMGRGGFLQDQLPGLMTRLESYRNLEVEGIGSHLPAADEDPEFTQSQIARFREIIEELGGPSRFRWRHLLNSAGLLGYDRALCNLARPGLMIYGVSPLPAYQHRLSTVMALKSRVTLVRTLPTGHGVSYGRQFVTSKPTRVATIGIGYGDGYPRAVSGNGARVWINGHSCPILGRVTMDQLMVDVSAAETINAGDEVEMFGPNIPVCEVAAQANTIAWEIFTGITPRVVRCYGQSGS